MLQRAVEAESARGAAKTGQSQEEEGAPPRMHGKETEPPRGGGADELQAAALQDRSLQHEAFSAKARGEGKEDGSPPPKCVAFIKHPLIGHFCFLSSVTQLLK